jgi:deoxyadenosine/deoxycytidine kinase
MATTDSTPPADRRRRGGIGIVGPCGSGKTTLITGLQAHGLVARQIAQEHSHVRDMWRRLAAPSVLIFLDASYETCTERKHFDWPIEDYQEQQRRLEHARREADVYVMTDGLTPQAVAEHVLMAIGRPPSPPGAAR